MVLPPGDIGAVVVVDSCTHYYIRIPYHFDINFFLYIFRGVSMLLKARLSLAQDMERTMQDIFPCSVSALMIHPLEEKKA